MSCSFLFTVFKNGSADLSSPPHQLHFSTQTVLQYRGKTLSGLESRGCFVFRVGAVDMIWSMMMMMMVVVV